VLIIWFSNLINMLLVKLYSTSFCCHESYAW